MNKLANHDSASAASHRMGAAILAPVVAVAGTATLLILVVVAFPRSKAVLGVAFFGAPVIGAVIGIVVYRLFAYPDSKHDSNDALPHSFLPRNSLPEAVWTIGFGLQIFAYLFLTVALMNDFTIVPRRHAHSFWVLFNVYAFGFMAISNGAVFWMFPSWAEKLKYAISTTILFAIMYWAFLSYATWVADPTTIPYKISG